MSSLGDVVHLLPAITDAVKARPELKFDWVVEKGFSEIPAWHPAVDKVIPIELRQWRKGPWEAFKNGAWHAFKKDLQVRTYAGVLDAQGLFKSSLVSLLAKGPRIGFDRNSAREGLASLFYNQKIEAPRGQHAVERLRILFAKTFDYPIPTTPPDFGIDVNQLTPIKVSDRYLVFLHGTTWDTKHWPFIYWQQLIQKAQMVNFEIYLPWGNEAEYQRAQSLATFAPNFVRVLPKLTLKEMTYVLAKAKGIVAVDTGLGHIAAALGRPVVSLYGPTDPGLTGAHGPQSQKLSSTLPCAPCFKRSCTLETKDMIQPPCLKDITPEQVWQTIYSKMTNEAAQSH
ncbi:MAG: lipopolysaccharide heptosyltransferase I [Gammaproteobacteria bacterium]